MTKKLIALLAVAALALSAAACSPKETPSSTETAPTTQTPTEPSSTEEAPAEEASVELIVFAAASMTETLTEIAELYKAVAPNVDIVYNFDSSGTLATQIIEGADCDVFISAAPKQMNQIDKNGDAQVNPDGHDFVLEGTRLDLLENKVVLVTAKDSEGEITSFEDLTTDKVNMLCIGNEDVPVGGYSLKIFEYLGTSAADFEAEGKITYGSNVKEVTTQVSEGAVDCGIIYATDAFSAGLTPVAEATPEMCGQVIYPAAVMKHTKNVPEAKAFLEYLKGDESSAVFKAVGFTPLAN